MNMELSRRSFMIGAGAGLAGTTIGALGFGEIEAAHALSIRPFKLAQTKGGPVHPEQPGQRNAEAMEGVKHIDEKLRTAGWKVTQQTYDTQLIDPMFMEPESGLAWLDKGTDTLHLLIGSQSPQNDANNAAELFGEPGSQFKVKTVDFTSCYLGGGFGGRDTSILCLYLALAGVYALIGGLLAARLFRWAPRS